MSEVRNYDAVCVGAHPDDVEIGMGGTVAKMTAAGLRVCIVDLTNGEPTPRGSVEVRAAEASKAAAALSADRRTLSQPNRFLFDTVEARFELAAVLRELRPRMLFAPYPVDAHPDHVAASQIAIAGRFYAKLTKTDLPFEPHFPGRVFHYMAVHQRIIAEPTFVVDITEQIAQKSAALAAYRSQFVDNDANASVIPMVESLATMWGTMSHVEYGEPFFALEPIALDSPDQVL